MHIATVNKPTQWDKRVYEPGAYALEDHNSAEFLWASRGLGEVSLLASDYPEFDPSQLKSGERLLVVRVGGFGDLLWLNPIYEILRERGIHITHACFDRYAPVLDGFVDMVAPYPMSVEAMAGYDQIVWLENVIEGRACLNGEHPADRLAKIFDVKPNRRTAYAITEQERRWAAVEWPRNDAPRVCVQLQSSTACKDYRRIAETMGMLAGKGYEQLMVGAPRDVEARPLPEGVYDATQKRHSIRKSIAMASFCDVILAPDSLMVHVGDALGIPVVGLYGPFDGKTYMKGYNGTPIQGDLDCSPCSWHPRGSAFPPDQPCARRGYCLALNNVTPEFVAAMVERNIKLRQHEQKNAK